MDDGHASKITKTFFNQIAKNLLMSHTTLNLKKIKKLLLQKIRLKDDYWLSEVIRGPSPPFSLKYAWCCLLGLFSRSFGTQYFFSLFIKLLKFRLWGRVFKNLSQGHRPHQPNKPFPLWRVHPNASVLHPTGASITEMATSLNPLWDQLPAYLHRVNIRLTLSKGPILREFGAPHRRTTLSQMTQRDRENSFNSTSLQKV